MRTTTTMGDRSRTPSPPTTTHPRRGLRGLRLLVALTLLGTLVLGTGGTALANGTGDPASCAGISISAHALAGHWRAELQAVQALLGSADLTLGDLLQAFAQRHEVTHDPGCETALVEILTNLGALP